ncbi:DUF2301 domain-containing membrane protein [Pseudanabaena sp. PCC 6802]|uniref:DUF2301 domain-containing membrane protein n=1 Tax=Pseudanabaena sp. PCC 6802 TaxID=118173 RepID=UPI000349D149|nr:DUF2301 domain-containing membrane protein [Pseudanabaena sp. PCC 6802]
MNASKQNNMESQVYQGQFGEFTITGSDRRDVVIYRAALAVAALCFSSGGLLFLWQADGVDVNVLHLLTWLYGLFCIALGVALAKIHIYLAALHKALQAFWLIGCISSIALVFTNREPLAIAVYQNPTMLLGIGFTFAALTGIYFKEAFCFNRSETKILTVLVPFLLLGHMSGMLSVTWERILLATWIALFLVFAFRKVIQAIPPDIGDKSVFAYLKEQKNSVAT